CSPVATFAFLATTTTPRARPLAALARLRTTEGPAKRDRVKTAEEAGVGPSLTTTTTSSPSSRSPAAPEWARNPAGSGIDAEGSGEAFMTMLSPSAATVVIDGPPARLLRPVDTGLKCDRDPFVIRFIDKKRSTLYA